MVSGELKHHGDVEMEHVVTVLAVGCGREDRRRLSQIFHSSNWVLHKVRNCVQAKKALAARRTAVLLCERDIADGCWMDLLRECEQSKCRPLVVVTSHKADDALWAEVLNLGGYDVLAEPFDPREVVRVLSLAWRHWKDRTSPRRAESMWAASVA
jgi:DNA-binding NtrC family response regulator